MQVEHQSTQLCAVVIGASHGGVNVAFNLRQQGWQGKIIVLDSDEELPYHRPPLSKKTLQSELLISTPLKVQRAYTDHNIDLRLGQTVITLDKQLKQLALASNEIIDFDKLVIATGCSAFIPPIKGLESAPFFTMRTFKDVQAIKQALKTSKDKQVVIIGGGYIGLEAASSFVGLGANVTVIEKQAAVLSRVTSEAMSSFISQLHTSNGVSLQTNKDVAAIKAQGEKHYVVCSDGSEYPADFILVGVGVRLNTQLALDAGLEVEHGINVNEVCQTSHPDIFAIGDCSRHFSPLYQRWIRLESVQNAVDQAKAAAQFIVNNKVLEPTVPWFWSDQYTTKLQIVGLSEGYDELIIRKDTNTQFSLWYFKGQKLLCVEAANSAKAYVLGMQIIKQGLSVNKLILQDPTTALNKAQLITAQ